MTEADVILVDEVEVGDRLDWAGHDATVLAIEPRRHGRGLIVVLATPAGEMRAHYYRTERVRMLYRSRHRHPSSRVE